MHITEIRERLQSTPFVPVRVHVADGSVYEVSHPGCALLARWAIHIGIQGDDPELPDRVVRVAIGHVTRLEELGSKSA